MTSQALSQALANRRAGYSLPGRFYNDAAVFEKYGVQPASIPDYLALVGDAADGFPGIAGWGAKSAATVLARHAHLENIPPDPAQLGLAGARGIKLAATFHKQREAALLFRRLATLRDDVPIKESIADLEWHGAQPQLRQLCTDLGEKTLAERVARWRENAS